MKAKKDVVGKIVKVEKQKAIYAGDLLCPVCERQGEDFDWEQINGEMRVRCECVYCDVAYEVWFTLNYEEHREIVDCGEEREKMLIWLEHEKNK